MAAVHLCLRLTIEHYAYLDIMVHPAVLLDVVSKSMSFLEAEQVCSALALVNF